ncbi:MAG: hypothetical protein GWP27_06880 [Bacteroidetes bacterium]|nr:hypothetical protein [Bacteroidota bacterium]
MLSTTHHRWIYLAGLALIVIGLPFSKAFISIGEIVIAVNFLLEGRIKERWNELKQNRTALLFVAFFFVHILALLWTNDLSFALKDLRVKLPLLLFPVVIPLSPKLSRKEFHWIVGLFILAVLITSVMSTYQYIHVRDILGTDYRDLSLCTSHIRYSLMVCFAYLFLLYAAWNESKNILSKLTYVALAIWLSVFIFILQSMTGMIVWFMCSYLLLLYTMFHIQSQRIRTIGFTVLVVTPLIIGSYVLLQIDAYYPNEKPDFSNLDQYSAGGELYDSDTTNLSLENGHYTQLYRAHNEMTREWEERSPIPIKEGRDRKGHFVRTTLIRYLTSKGLRKDSVGVNSLTDDDVHAIENGIANVRFTYGNPIDNRIYIVIWEFDRLLREQRVQGHSVTQRILFWKTGWEIFKENWLFGVGTGDANRAFNAKYDEQVEALPDQYRLRAHNQFLTVGITMGILGLLIFLIGAAYPFTKLKTANSFLYIGFAIILYVSMFNEDTLETQVGVTLFAFFNALLLFGYSADSEEMTSL